MIDTRLLQLLGGLETRRRKARWWRTLAVGCMATGLALVLSGWLRRVGLPLPGGGWVFLAGLLGTVFALLLVRRRRADLQSVAAELERSFPKSHPVLSTALEQRPDPATGRFTFLQQRVFNEALAHRERLSWEDHFGRKVLLARGTAVLALLGLLASAGFNMNSRARALIASEPKAGVTVDPGNVEVQRGTGLVISARFHGKVPSDATLVTVTESGKTNRLALQRHLADPIFGISLMEIAESGMYHVEYAGKRSDEYRITVFEFPALVRADATLTFPEYTGLTNRTIPDTLRVSAVEGARLAFRFELNKPVAQARLVGKNGTLKLETSADSVALLNPLTLTNSDRYALRLIDREGRTNVVVSEIVVQVLPNKAPELKLVFPRGDQRVTSVQELSLEAQATDDFGLLKCGFGFGVAGGEPTIVEHAGRGLSNRKQDFRELVNLESLNLSPGDLFSYFVWADDFGSDGKVRRTYSDMFFAEVRPFEQVFRPDQSGEAEGGGGGGEQQQNGGSRLSELQKQIVIATWKIQREKGGKP